MNKLTENNIEAFAIETLQALSWEYNHGIREKKLNLSTDYSIKTAMK